MNKPRIGIIVGSNRPNRICPAIAEWLKNAMANEELDLGLIDLAEINLPFLDEPNIPANGNYQKEHTKAWSKRVQEYDGFVLLFPQYNWGYPAVLKNALDFLYDEWAGKPVSIMCYGNHGGFQGALAIRMVVQGLKMNTLSTNIPLNIEEEMFDSNGQFKNIDSALASYGTSAKLLSEEFLSILQNK